METLRVGRWEISCDPEATRNAYVSILRGGPEECGCEGCRNFAAARSQAYPPKVLALFEALGIPPDREVEVCHFGRLAPGKHLYGGWFHFVGSILSGGDARKQRTEKVWQVELEDINDDFSLGFTSFVTLAREPMKGMPLIQLEFTAKVPWVLPTSEPA